jgi:uncharacterized membrane protein
MKPNLNQTAITYGIITGLIYLALTFGAWSIGSTDTFVSITGITTFIPYVIVTLIIVGIKLRKSNDNLLSFQEALKFSFLAYVIYALIEAIGNYVLYALVDPDLTAKVMEITMQKTMKSHLAQPSNKWKKPWARLKLNPSILLSNKYS